MFRFRLCTAEDRHWSQWKDVECLRLLRSLISKTTTEIRNHWGVEDKTLAEFVIDLGQSSSSLEEFKEKLAENGAESEDNSPAISILRTGMNKTMKTLERGFGIDIGWCYEQFAKGNYVLIHTRSSHQSADIYTRGINDGSSWKRLRRLINIYSLDEIKDKEFNPDVSSYPLKDLQDGTPDSADLNPHYKHWPLKGG